jgi:hypothetical protein
MSVLISLTFIQCLPISVNTRIIGTGIFPTEYMMFRFFGKNVLYNKSVDLENCPIKLVISNSESCFPLKMAQQGRNR